MTSLAETYLSCKTAMANKLNAKGITDASPTDGLTTLINYIDDIDSSVNGLLLSADKSIAQSGDTINFTAVCIDNGNVVSGKSVNFYGLKSATSTSKSLTADTWTPVGCKFGVSVDSSVAGILALTKDSTPVSIVAAEGGLIVNIPNKSPYSNVSNIVFEDGILSFTYNGNTVTEDLSSYDCTNVNASVSGFTISDYGVFDTTDANGVATATYQCTGAGLQSITAKTTLNGIFLQETCEVCDCYVIDEAVTGKKNDTDVFIYSNRVTDTDLYDDGCKLVNTTSSQGLYAFGKHGTTHTAWNDFIEFSDPFAFEVDIIDYDSTGSGLFLNTLTETISIPFSSLGTLGTGTNHLKLTWDGSKYKVYVNNSVDPVVDLVYAPPTVRVGLYVYASPNKYLKYANVKIYPI